MEYQQFYSSMMAFKCTIIEISSEHMAMPEFVEAAAEEQGACVRDARIDRVIGGGGSSHPRSEIAIGVSVAIQGGAAEKHDQRVLGHSLERRDEPTLSVGRKAGADEHERGASGDEQYRDSKGANAERGKQAVAAFSDVRVEEGLSGDRSEGVRSRGFAVWSSPRVCFGWHPRP